MHNDVKPTDKLCYSLKLSAVIVTVVIICILNDPPKNYDLTRDKPLKAF